MGVHRNPVRVSTSGDARDRANAIPSKCQGHSNRSQTTDKWTKKRWGKNAMNLDYIWSKFPKYQLEKFGFLIQFRNQPLKIRDFEIHRSVVKFIEAGPTREQESDDDRATVRINQRWTHTHTHGHWHFSARFADVTDHHLFGKKNWYNRDSERGRIQKPHFKFD